MSVGSAGDASSGRDVSRRCLFCLRLVSGGVNTSDGGGASSLNDPGVTDNEGAFVIGVSLGIGTINGMERAGSGLPINPLLTC